ncbi:MAG: hypothetical protein J7K75_00300 [Desulfuromonas sp.]|nr:hypothetical protein [Desulfuromonas sp.]
MTFDSQQAARRWQQIVLDVRKEVFSLREDERLWIVQHLALIKNLQQQIHSLFIGANGPELCHNCLGSCCELGHNHMTLANLLSALLSDSLPQADFERTCPFLGEQGCTLDVPVRPYNCVTFICDAVENALSPEERNRFYALDQQLRSLYLAFDQRYIGSSLQGLLIRSQSMPGNQFLARR